MQCTWDLLEGDQSALLSGPSPCLTPRLTLPLFLCDWKQGGMRWALGRHQASTLHTDKSQWVPRFIMPLELYVWSSRPLDGLGLGLLPPGHCPARLE